jgi:hypothetical protein
MAELPELLATTDSDLDLDADFDFTQEPAQDRSQAPVNALLRRRWLTNCARCVVSIVQPPTCRDQDLNFGLEDAHEYDTHLGLIQIPAKACSTDLLDEPSR